MIIIKHTIVSSLHAAERKSSSKYEAWLVGGDPHGDHGDRQGDHGNHGDHGDRQGDQHGDHGKRSTNKISRKH